LDLPTVQALLYSYITEKNINFLAMEKESRSSFVLIIGFGILIVLIGVLGFRAVQRADSIYQEMQVAQDAYLHSEEFRRGFVADMFFSDILVRDYLLDPSTDSAQARRQDVQTMRDSLQERLDMFSASLGENLAPDLAKLQSKVEAYWESLDPIFDWTTKEKSDRAWVFLTRRVLPRREAVVSLAREMARINSENLEKERKRIAASQEVLWRFLLQMTAVALAIGTLVAILTTHRVLVLERKHEFQRKQIEETQNNLRRLSNRLVQAQEGERRELSRELHDEVGQTMTALGIELGNLEDIRDSDPKTFRRQLEELKRLNADTMRGIRDLAMGLRPSMLDDIGLEAALQWQGREFSRHTGVPARVEVDGNLDDLSDAQRTCMYRVVQEALTNCARHAKANNVIVSVRSMDSGIVVRISDDGVGFDVKSSRGGLGLLGMQERVKALSGNLRMSAETMGGTTIHVWLPRGTVA
jgi:signal transduction histidine kinase